MNRTQMQEILRSIDPLNNTTVLADYEDYADDLRKALAAAGYAVVPVEPTNRMIEDGGQHLPTQYTLTECYTMIRTAWKDMIAAAKGEA